MPDMVLTTRDAILPMIDKFPDIRKLIAYRQIPTNESVIAI